MRNCASGNLEIPGSMLRIAPERRFLDRKLLIRISNSQALRVSSLANTASRSRRIIRASFALNFPLSENRGRRECRAPDAPAAARVVVESTRVSHHGHAGSPGIPRAMVLTVFFALSPVIGLSCHRHRRKCIPPT
jgi:hypothetical protein